MTTTLNHPAEILQITDTHLFSDPRGQLEGCVTDESLHRVIETVKHSQRRPELIVATGDLVHDESRAGYQRLRNHLESFGVPILAIPGNHDFPPLMDELYCDGLMRFCDRGSIRNWRVYLLNTFVASAVGGRVDPLALAAIHRDIQAEPETHALVCLHHHPVLIQSAWLDALGIENAELFNGFVRSHPQIRAVIWGHIHQEWDEQRGQARYLGTPSTCFQFAPRLERMALDTRQPGARWLTLYDNGRLETEVVRSASSGVR